MVKKVDKLLAKLVLERAIGVERIPSLWGCYQPKEPKELIEKLRNEKERFKKEQWLYGADSVFVILTQVYRMSLSEVCHEDNSNKAMVAFQCSRFIDRTKQLRSCFKFGECGVRFAEPHQRQRW